jgi:Fic family protein
MKYIHHLSNWPKFYWDQEKIAQTLTDVRHRQGLLVGKMNALGFSLRDEAILQTLTLDVLKSNEIEGEILNPEQVSSSIARRLGMPVGGLIPSDHHVDGVVEMMLDATQNFETALSDERLFNWQAALFPTGRSGMYKITTGDWRKGDRGPMQVVSGPIGQERVHYEAPDSSVLEKEMERFLEWFNNKIDIDPVLKAAIAHLWFVTIHPFDDGNGRITRAITDMQLARADKSAQRFYSMSAQILKERKQYYDLLESSQKSDDLDITKWLDWFFACLNRALDATQEILAAVFSKAHFWDKNFNKPIKERQRIMLNKLLDGFTGKLTSAKWAKITKCSHDTALRDIKDLIKQGMLIQDDLGGRSTSYSLKD